MSVAAIAPIPLEIAASRLEGSVKDKEAASAAEDASAFEEGGLRGWLNVAGAFVSGSRPLIELLLTLRIRS